MNTNFKFIGLTRLGIKPKSTAPEADALNTRLSENVRQLDFEDIIVDFCSGKLEKFNVKLVNFYLPIHSGPQLK